MLRTFLFALVPTTMLLAVPVLAQESGPTAESAQTGQTYIRETFTDWGLRCIRGAGAAENDTCQLYQLLRDDAGNSVAEFTVLPAPRGNAIAALITVVTPLETLLTEGMTLSIDDTPLPPKPYAWCNRNGCFSRFGITQPELESLKRGSVATVSIVAMAAPDRRIGLTSSLRGFTAAFDTLAEEVNARVQ